MAYLVYANDRHTRRLSTRSEYVHTNGEDTLFGVKDAYLGISSRGHVSLVGEATVWDEVSQSFAGKRILESAGRVDYNFIDLTVDFSATARYPEEPVGIVLQTLHARKEGSDIRPHIHWMQDSDVTPNILVEYRFCNNGGVPTAWVLKALTATDNMFPYVAGAQQITEFNLPEGHGLTLALSGTFECKIYRDSLNTSGLFAGADTYSGVWKAKYYDMHIQMDSLGSREEFVK